MGYILAPAKSRERNEKLKVQKYFEGCPEEVE